MGGGTWSDDAYAARTTMRASTAKSTGKSVHAATFAHMDHLRSTGKALVAHESLDPKSVNKRGDHTGKNIRESLDSDAHPESVAVAVLFDTTGSMQSIPILMQEKLPKLMGLLVRKNYLDHPQVLLGAFNDMHAGARVPVQVGQFEAGIEIDDNLTNLVFEGGGGGTDQESYELAAYFMARHTYMDCLEKRGKKGYLFIIGDECPYPKVDRSQVKAIIGDDIQDSIETSVIFAELLEKFEVFYIMPGGTSNFGREVILKPWRKLIGQNVIQLENPNDVCECIAGQIGVCEGRTDSTRVVDDLTDAGTDDASARAVSKALVVTGTGTAAIVGTVTGGSLATTSTDDVGRL